jgi:hypothetical protein
MAISSQDIQNFLAANPGMTDAQIVDAMRFYGVSPEQMATAVNLPLENVQSRISATERKSGLAGQYGYANNAPILNASVAKSLLGDEFYKKIDTAQNELGWGTNSKYQGSIRTGVGLYGIEGSKSEINRLLEIGQKAKEDFAAGKIIATQDPETGETRFAERINTEDGPQYSFSAAYQRFGTGDEDSNAMQNFAKWQDTTSKLQDAAKNIGINTSGLTDKQIFDAINAVDKRVLVTGRTQFWDKAQTGIGGQEGPQHAAVVYTQQDGKLVPVSQPQTFTFQDPNTTRGFFGDLASFAVDLIKIPPISMALAAYFGPQLGAYLASTYGLSPAIAQTLASSAINTAIKTAATGDIEAGLQSGLLSAAGSSVSNLLPGAVDAGGGGAAELASVGETGYGLTGPIISTTPGLLDTANFQPSLPEMGGGTGITVTPTQLPPVETIGIEPVDYSLGTPTGGVGLTVPTMPNIASMGGAQGLTVPVTEGTVGQLGLTPTGATPVLGSPSSFINNPEVLGQPVIQQGTPTTIDPRDILRTANTLRQLTNQPEQPQAPQTPQVTQGGPTGIDYSGLLNLLASQARTSGLLGTKFQPQTINLASLLG